MATKVWTYESLVCGHRAERVAALAGDLASGAVTTDELLHVLDHLEARFEYYHGHYWDTVVKGIMATVILLAAPYYVLTSLRLGNALILVVCPVLAIAVSAFCLFGLKSEEAQTNNIELKTQALYEALSPHLADFDLAIFTKVPFFKAMNRRRAANFVLFLFSAIMVTAVLEIGAIAFGWLTPA